MKYKITDYCYALENSKTVIVFQLKKIQIPFQGDDTKGLEEGN